MTQPDATPFAFPSNLHSSLFLRFQIKKDKQKYGNVTQAEFRSFNEVGKQIAYACMCFLISSFFFDYTFSISSTAPEEACHHYFSDVKERSIFFPS